MPVEGAAPAARAAKQTLDDVAVEGRTVLVRVDFNVPMRDGRIVDDRRIRAALPTLERLRERGARVIVLTHLGRPGGRSDAALSVRPLADRLAELLGGEVELAGDVAGPLSQEMAARLRPGEVGMLENVRFEPGEERNDPALAARFAELADIYVNDAFGTAHRAHASTEGIAHRLPAVAGYLMAEELGQLGGVLDAPARPLVAILGGSKISSKLGVLRTLVERVDVLWIGGAMACTFYRALGEEVGRSLVEDDQVAVAEELLRVARTGHCDLHLPIDVVVARSTDPGAKTTVVSWKEIPADQTVVDIGPDTVIGIARSCHDAATVVWNGPLGIYEVPGFARGTRAVAETVAAASAVTVVGGGDLAAALDQAGVTDRISHVSTGGGATLEFLEGRTLPGVAALLDRGAPVPAKAPRVAPPTGPDPAEPRWGGVGIRAADPTQRVAARPARRPAGERATPPASERMPARGARRPLVVGNWKMHTTVLEGLALGRELLTALGEPGVEVAVLPPFPHLWPLHQLLEGSAIAIGAQDVFWEDRGAFTGEVSPASLSGWCQWVLVGHSERRHLLGETDEQVGCKLGRALGHDLQVILAVGETLDERNGGRTMRVIRRQLDTALAAAAEADLGRLVVAYEPVWAIGTGRTATPHEAQLVCHAIREHLEDCYAAAAVAELRVLYGGSVTAGSAAELFAQADIDGGLIGGASLSTEAFSAIVSAAGASARVR
ncbi:MAG: triose-phosphate isomerase [Candidatus Dormibacteria bacterium]